MLLNELNNEPWNQDYRSALDAYHSFFQDEDKAEPSEEFTVDERLRAKLEALGWKFVAAGFYSLVFEKPDQPNSVLKVNTLFDDGFAKFAILSRKTKNPHFQKISNAKIFHVGNRDYAAYMLEKLYPLVMPMNKKKWFGRLCNQAVRFGFDSLGPKQQKTISIDPEFIEALNILHQSKYSYKADIHSGNLMQRKDGTLVISDPWK